MLFCSTRDKAARVTASQAILNGLAPDGGLYLPCELPQFTEQQIDRMKKLDYRQTALTVLQAFLPDYSAEELEDAINKAYGSNFSSSQIAPLTSVKGNMWSLELYHGPTCAFKDFALQMLPHLMAGAMKKHADGKTVAILVATSGDTGKAALEGFANVPGTKICVFYPHGGTSEIQRLQMATQQGDNVNVLAVKGNFDDAQSGVKAIFTDAELAEKLAEHGVSLSSANSINWGRLAPQIAYYFWAYARLLRSGRICMGDPVNFCVPTGNFGNILAGYFAKKCGLPIDKLICASNQNNVLTQFFNTGVYDRNRPFHLTDSPSMDILISSNLERLLFLLTDGDDAQVREWMDSLKKNGKYDIGEAFLEKLRAEGFRGYCADDQRTRGAAAKIQRQRGEIPDAQIRHHVFTDAGNGILQLGDAAQAEPLLHGGGDHLPLHLHALQIRHGIAGAEAQQCQYLFAVQPLMSRGNGNAFHLQIHRHLALNAAHQIRKL